METEIDKLIYQAIVARKAIAAQDDNYITHLQNAKDEALRIVKELDGARRAADAQRAQLKSQMEQARKELDQVNLQIKEARRELEGTLKSRDNLKAEMRSIFDEFASRKVA
jgi:chromosome segregation ATPase